MSLEKNLTTSDANATSTKPRVMYLDVDDTLLVWNDTVSGFAAPLAVEFVKWAAEHFEVRWLTMWATRGIMSEEGVEELHYRFNYKIPVETFLSFKNPKAFYDYKTVGVDFAEERPWVWVEDKLLPNEVTEMKQRNKLDNFYLTNVSEDIMALHKTWVKLAQRFNLPGPPAEYSRECDMPKQALTVEDIISIVRKKNV